jgi:hypothetical protein
MAVDAHAPTPANAAVTTHPNARKRGLTIAL